MANFCENCGSPVQNDNRFCSNCGAPVNQPEPDVPVAPVVPPEVPAPLRLREERRALLYRRNHSRNLHGVLCSSPRNRPNSVLLIIMRSNRRCSHTTARKLRNSLPMNNKPGKKHLLPDACPWGPRLTAVQGPNTNRIRISSPCICVTTTG